jgi:hypothetical protein
MPLFPEAGGGVVEDVGGVVEDVGGGGVVEDVVGGGVVEDVVEAAVGCGTQFDSFVLPSVAEYLPFAQSRQSLPPSADEYLPIPHRRHALRPVAFEYFPALQFTQSPAPGRGWEVPRGHG